jgi:hypothetical protein
LRSAHRLLEYPSESRSFSEVVFQKGDRMFRIRISCALALLCALTAACGESPARLSPTAASAIVTTVGNTTNSTASVVDRTDGAVRDAETVSTWAAGRGWALVDGLAVEGTAAISAITGTCPSVVITVLGVPVTVNSTTTYGTGITCAGLTTGTTVKVTGLLTFTASSFSVVATNISLPTSGGGSPTEVEVTGVVASVSGTCPALTITLEGTGGVVKTTATTTFDPTGSCSSIAAGTMIEARGTRNSTSQLEATSVAIEDDTTSGGGHGRGRRIGGDGTIGAVTGTCPTLTMVVRGFRVVTTSATVFEGGTCASIRPGTKANIEGATQSDGSLRATKVKILEIPGSDQE